VFSRLTDSRISSTVWFEAATVVPLYAPAVATGSVLKSALAGGLACAIPTFFLHPVDTMKVSRRMRNVWHYDC
jgi:hypothetical protein